MYTTISLILFIIISLIYNLYIILKYKTIPVSLSETSYILGGFKRYWFSAYCITTVMLILPLLLMTIPENLAFLGFLMCGGLLFAGLSPMFKNGMDKTLHYTSSMFSFIIFIIFMIFIMGWFYLALYVWLLALLTLCKKECYVYFAEILVYIFIILFII